MDPAQFFIGGLWIAVKVSAPMLLSIMGVGLCVSIVQALTQIQEQTLQFVIKTCVCLAVLVATGRWIGVELMQLCINAFETIGLAGR